MRLALLCHPATPCEAVTRIDVDVTRSAGALDLRYVLTGTIANLRLAPAAASARTNELWKHTCVEAFVRTRGASAYYEFNFAPSTQWASYHFTATRAGMRDATEIAASRLSVQSSDSTFELHAALTLGDLPDLPTAAAWQLGLSAVTEEMSGRKSYWALRHPPGRPDFHHPDCFAQEIPPASGT